MPPRTAGIPTGTDIDPPLPVLIYDGDCGFCAASAARLRRWAGDRLSLVPLQRTGILERFGIPRGEALRAVQLIDRRGRRFAGAEAMLRALAVRAAARPLLWICLLPGIRALSDRAYRAFASRRGAGACASNFKSSRPK